MGANTFGRLYQLHSFGESHGKAIGGIVEGFPAGFELDMSLIKFELLRRRTNQGIFSSKRSEPDDIQFLSGIFEGKTLGTPIAFAVENSNANPKDYESIRDIYRPSHADYTWEMKFGLRDYRGGGRSSARETLSRVVAGAMAKQYLEKMGISITAWVQQIGDIQSEEKSMVDGKEIENSILRCPDALAERQMLQRIDVAAKQGDTLGGVIKCSIRGLKAGLGEPVFDKLQALLAHAILSINAVKGFEYGSGFASAAMRGSEHNDEFVMKNSKITTATNHSGGIQGGISNGEEVYFNAAFKPVASISKVQKTVDNKGELIEVEIKGRHDVCVLPRAVPIVEAMAAMVIMDLVLLQNNNQY